MERLFEDESSFLSIFSSLVVDWSTTDTDTDGGDDLTVKGGPASPLHSNSSKSFILSLIMDAMISLLV